VAAFITSQREQHGIPHATCCRALGVSQAWFYKCLGHASAGTLPPRAARRRRLAAEVKRLFGLYQGKRGSPMITAELREAGWRVSENTVAAVMREQRPDGQRGSPHRPGDCAVLPGPRVIASHRALVRITQAARPIRAASAGHCCGSGVVLYITCIRRLYATSTCQPVNSGSWPIHSTW
jgi:HTH-like domain